MNGSMVLKMLDIFLTAAAPFVFGVIFDAATPHQVVRRVLFGMPTKEDLVLLEDPSLTFFSKVSHCELPQHGLPRLPIRVTMFESEPYVAFCGTCALPCI